MTLEVCIDSVQSAINAQKGGADRVELCDNLFEGGTTPSAGMIMQVRKAIDIGLQVMIRPRGGDFLYSEDEIEVMLHDIKVAKELGADGIVFGCLNPDGTVDEELSKRFIEASEGMNVTFHRAFDMVADPQEALEALIRLGIDRVLTSGLERSAIEGIDCIKEMVEQAGDRIIILAGGGVRPHNIDKLVKNTGVKECHVSGRTAVASQMTFKNTRVGMGGALSLPEFSTSVVNSEIISGFRA